MSRTVIVGTKLIDLDEKSPMRLLNSLNWLEEQEADTPENMVVQKQLKDELRSRGWAMDYDYKAEKKFNICLASQWPFKYAAKCCLKKSHKGEHFSNDRPGKLVYWA